MQSGHTYPYRHSAALHSNYVLLFAVYFRPMSVSITVTNNELDVLDVPDVVVGGGGSSDLPPVGMLPAKIEVDSAHTSTSAIANRFMDVAPLRF